MSLKRENSEKKYSKTRAHSLILFSCLCVLNFCSSRRCKMKILFMHLTLTDSWLLVAGSPLSWAVMLWHQEACLTRRTSMSCLLSTSVCMTEKCLTVFWESLKPSTVHWSPRGGDIYLCSLETCRPGVGQSLESPCSSDRLLEKAKPWLLDLCRRLPTSSITTGLDRQVDLSLGQQFWSFLISGPFTLPKLLRITKD